MQYTKSYAWAVLFLQDIFLFDLTFFKFMTMRKTQTKNIVEMCFDTVRHFLYILHYKKHVGVKVKAIKSIN